MKYIISLLDEEIQKGSGDKLVEPSQAGLKMAEEAVATITKTVPRFNDMFTGFEIKFSSNVPGVGMFIKGTASKNKPLVLVDENELVRASSKYKVNLQDQFKVTVYHEFCHAIQERLGLPFDENQAENFGRTLRDTGKIIEDVNNEITNWGNK